MLTHCLSVGKFWKVYLIKLSKINKLSVERAGVSISSADCFHVLEASSTNTPIKMSGDVRLVKM